MNQDSDGVAEALRGGAQLAVTLGAQSLEAAARMRERSRLQAAAADRQHAEDLSRRLAAERALMLVATADRADRADRAVAEAAQRVAATSQAMPAGDVMRVPAPSAAALAATPRTAPAVRSVQEPQR